MRLMVRKKGCVTVEPYIIDDCPEVEQPTRRPSIVDYESQQNLFIVDSTTVINNIVGREYRELLQKLENDQDQPEACFIEQALQMLNERKLRLNQHMIPNQQHQSQFDDATRPNQHNNLDLTNSYLFYQSCDGQHIYLNPFSTKLLCHDHGSLENCPLKIRAKVLQMDWISMSEAWRKRFRYLSHLPLTCEFRLIEIDFEKSNLINPSTFKVYSDQIRAREMARERSRREERKREQIIKVEQDRKIYGIGPSLKININNPDQFPSVSDERYIGLSLATDHSARDLEIFDLSSDEYEDGIDEQLTDVQTQELESSKTTAIADPVLKVTHSFAEIQLQEAAAAAAIDATILSKTPSNLWGKKSSSKNQSNTGSDKQASTSFAQLLSNAKTSKQEWTIKSSISKPVTASTQSCNIESSFPRLGGPSYYDPFNELGSDHEDQEELKAPGNFTISDFIDNNIVTSSSKRMKSKQKSSVGNIKK